MKKRNPPPPTGPRPLEGRGCPAHHSAPMPGLRKHITNTYCLTRLIGGQNEYRIKKKKESRVRFTGH